MIHKPQLLGVGSCESATPIEGRKPREYTCSRSIPNLYNFASPISAHFAPIFA
jgi:hypothetical protein